MASVSAPLTRRIADFAVIFGLVLLASALYGALVLTLMDLGWWLGHLFEVVGTAVVGASAAYDLRRGRRSRPLAGDLRAVEIVASEEAFLGARVRARMLTLAAKDTSTEEHTRRVAALAVEMGDWLGLSAGRLRSLAIGDCCMTWASSRCPTRSSRSSAPSTPTSSRRSSSIRSAVASF